MLTLVPAFHLARRLARRANPHPRTRAVRSWNIAQGETTTTPAAVFLPGQLERVTGYEFASANYMKDMYGGMETEHAPTTAYLIEDAILADGVLYKNDAAIFFDAVRRRIPPLRIEEEIAAAALYCSPGGHRYFGQWLIDDCVTYPLAAREGTPLTTRHAYGGHQPAYERLLGMSPHRSGAARIRELVIFDDFGQNRDKSGRFRALSDTLTDSVAHSGHPGVFLLRGSGGIKRILRNEREIAERLRTHRGFRVIDPLGLTVEEIVSACAGAEVVAGVEGSHLVHGLLCLKPGTALLTLMPPQRFCTPLKDIADRDGITFGFVVGTPVEDEFTVDADEVERTLDLLDRTKPRRLR